MNWTIKATSEKYMEVQLKFNKPKEVSKRFKHKVFLNFTQSLKLVSNTTVYNQSAPIGMDLLKPLTSIASPLLLSTTTILTEEITARISVNITLPRQFPDTITEEYVKNTIKRPSEATVKYSL